MHSRLKKVKSQKTRSKSRRRGSKWKEEAKMTKGGMRQFRGLPLAELDAPSDARGERPRAVASVILHSIFAEVSRATYLATVPVTCLRSHASCFLLVPPTRTTVPYLHLRVIVPGRSTRLRPIWKTLNWSAQDLSRDRL